jgi:pimeloyl-ACP methyl ester carboxylesterase
MKKCVFLLVVLTGAFAHAQNIAGDWQGTLKIGPSELRLVLHIAKGENGAFKATLDSIDQGANGIPVSSISLKESQLDLTIEAVHGSYQGKVNSEGTVITGTWTQTQPLPLEFRRTANPVKTEHKPAKPSDIDGDWLGTLDVNALKLRIIFHIINTADGLTATLDSPDQGANGLPVTSVIHTGFAIKMELKQIGGGFEGKLDKDLSTMEGIWTQGGGSLPLVLKRVKGAAELERRRPQDPTKPYPYREEELTYENKVQGVTLAATLTIPPGKGPFPAVVLITGSGPQDRDEALLGHRPFLVLSDYLTRKGIAVLRADDRGVGKSTGSFGKATTADFATDTEAGVAYLKSRPEVDQRKIGLIGHSEGGVIAPMVAARNADVAFIVMMAGSGVPGDAIIVEQLRLIEEASGKSHEQAEKDADDEREVLALIKQEKNEAVLENELREKLAGRVPKAQLGAAIQQATAPWFRYFIAYDPAPALTKVKCPVLAINGEKDLQVPPKQNLPAIRKALAAGGNKNSEVDELPGLNHLFQTAKTGAPSEYSSIEETISPVALEMIATWILKR